MFCVYFLQDGKFKGGKSYYYHFIRRDKGAQCVQQMIVKNEIQEKDNDPRERELHREKTESK